jgi:hypothetical protein
MSRIVVTIDQLVIKGVEAGDRSALVEGLKAELSESLAHPTTRQEWARSRRTHVLPLRRLPFQPGTSGARKFGSEIGRTIGRRLKS